MMQPKVIKSEEEYQAALAHLESLMDAVPGSAQETELELFAILIEKYEVEHYPIDLPDPIEAIKFRMEQQGLSRKDLVPYIGSQSKVSEVLNRKRPLSLNMIREVHEGLGIPYEVLMHEPDQALAEQRYRIQDYPFTDMFNRGYFESFTGSLQEAKLYAEELLVQFFSVFGDRQPERVLCRNSGDQMDELALSAWQAQVLHQVHENDYPTYVDDNLTLEFIRDLVKLSGNSTGPLLAKDALRQHGIPLVILKHLPKTYLDGACFNTISGRPVIGMTLRLDRLDNFWFTLVHELSHVYLHLRGGNLAFFDDTEQGTHHSCNPQEIEANELTAGILIPNEMWNRDKEALLYTNRETSVMAFADQLGISPAIVAGRIRWESDDYSRFDSLLGRRTVSLLFAQE